MHGADPHLKNINLQGPLHIAADRGFDGILVYTYKELCLDPSEIDSNKRNPLHIAALNGNISSSLFLIAWIQNINAKDCVGNTALHLAASSQCYKIVRNLLLRGADREIKNNDDKTALDLAIAANCLYLVKLLVVSI